jgi:hypothetical protein
MKRRAKSAQSLVEMAMIAPFLMLLLLTMIDFGRAAWTYSTLAGAAREGARAAVVTGNSRADDNRVVSAVKLYAIGMVLKQPTCMNDAPPASPSMSANTGLVYIGKPAGVVDPNAPNAPGGQAAAAAGTCGAIIPGYAGRYPLTVTIKYNFQALTPFASQFFPTGIVMTVSSTMNTEF